MGAAARPQGLAQSKTIKVSLLCTMSRRTHPSGLFTYAESTHDRQGTHYTGGVMRDGMTVEWITETGGLLLGWNGTKVVFDHIMPVVVHDCFRPLGGRHANVIKE